MARKRNRTSKTEDYVILLPHNISYSGMGEIPRIGFTKAGSPKKALSNHVARNVPGDQIGVFVDELGNFAKSQGYSGIEAYAFNVPNVTPADGQVFSPEEKREAVEIALAQEMAIATGKDNLNCLKAARMLYGAHLKNRADYLNSQESRR